MDNYHRIRELCMFVSLNRRKRRKKVNEMEIL